MTELAKVSYATVKFMDTNKNGQVDDQDRVELYEGDQKIWEGTKKDFVASKDLRADKTSDDYLSNLKPDEKLSLLQGQLDLEGGKTIPSGSLKLASESPPKIVTFADFMNNEAYAKNYGSKAERKEKVKQIMSFPAEKQVLSAKTDLRELKAEDLVSMKPRSKLRGEMMIESPNKICIERILDQALLEASPSKPERPLKGNQPKPGCRPGTVAP